MTYKECANGHIYDEKLHVQCPYCNGNDTQIIFGRSEVGVTVAPMTYSFDVRDNVRNDVGQGDLGKTVGVFEKIVSKEPVVGWFVCIDGADKGKDYRILAKNNTIGRSEKMDICILNDYTISGENYANIFYDAKNNDFHLIPGEQSNNIYIGEQPVYVPIKLNANDIINMGKTKLMFIPLCNDRFKWE